MYENESYFTGNIQNTDAVQDTGTVQDTDVVQDTDTVQSTDAVQDTHTVQSTDTVQDIGSVQGTDTVQDHGTVQNTGNTQYAGAVQNTGNAQYAGTVQNAGNTQYAGAVQNAGNAQYAGAVQNTGNRQYTGAAQNTSNTQYARNAHYAGGPQYTGNMQDANRGQYTGAVHSANNPFNAGQPYGTYNTNDTHNNIFDESNNQQSKKRDKKQKPPKTQKSGFGKKVLVSIGLGLFFGLFAGIGFYAVQQGTELLKKTSDTAVMSTPEETNAPEETDSGIKLITPQNVTVIESDVSDVVEEVMPAMVSIINNYTVTGQFWGHVYSEQENSSGSGIIVGETESELLIVSNNHVVQGADQLLITFIDGSEAEAHIKGLDADMDLAVIAVPLEELSDETRNNISIATLGDSDELKLGLPVIAIGNALGYGQSVTTGIVSALDREITFDDGSTGKFIQTDAAINPGNSGGALLNVNGEVIGINSSKIGGSVIEGMGYAIPITSASPIISDLMERQTRKDKVDAENAGYIGISYNAQQKITEEIAESFNMPQGIFVAAVEEGSPAEQVGIIPRDIITHFDGSRITTFEELQEILQYYAAGDTTEITIMRLENGEYVPYELEITLGKRPAGQ